MSKRLLKFHATWCVPCRATAPIVTKLAAKNNLPLEEIDIDAVPEAMAEWGVQSVPTVILVEDGVEVARAVGAMPLSRIANELGLDR